MNSENKYALSVNFTANKKIDGYIMWEVVKDALLSYSKQTGDNLLVYEVFVEERNNGGIKE